MPWSFKRSRPMRAGDGCGSTGADSREARGESRHGCAGRKIDRRRGCQGEGGFKTMAEQERDSEWNVVEWQGTMLVYRYGEKIGKLQDVYVVDVETGESQFGTVKEGFIGRHVTFVPLGPIRVGADELQVAVSKEQVEDPLNIEQHGEALSQAHESGLDHHYELDSTPPETQSGRRLARR